MNLLRGPHIFRIHQDDSVTFKVVLGMWDVEKETTTLNRTVNFKDMYRRPGIIYKTWDRNDKGSMNES